MKKTNVVSILALVCAARVAHADDWTEQGSDAARSHDTTEIAGPTFARAWTFALGGGQIVATPVTSGGAVVVAGSDGVVAEVDALTGKVLWTRTIAGGVRATPLIWRDRVIVSSMGGALYSLGLADGAVAWQRTFGGQNYSSPQLVPGGVAGQPDTLIVGAGFPAQDLWRFDALTGQPLWQTPKGAIPGLVYSSATVAAGRVVVGMNGGRFQSFDLATGTPDWRLDASGPVYLSSPLVVGDRVYAFPGDPGVHLFGVGASTGAPVPGFPASIPDLAPVPGTQPFGQGPAVSSPMTAGGLILVQLRRQDMQPVGRTYEVFMRETVVAVDPRSAQVRWQYAFASLTVPNPNGVPELGVCATPVSFAGPDGPLVAASSSITGRVVILDAATGHERWTADLPAGGRASPVLSNGQLLVATDDGVLTAFTSGNHAPEAPTSLAPTGAVPFTAAGTKLTWDAATDEDGDSLSYVVRVEEDGALATRVESPVPVGARSFVAALEAGKHYVYAVRSRDTRGALSVWSAPQRLEVIAAREPVAPAQPTDAGSPEAAADDARPPTPGASPPMTSGPAGWASGTPGPSNTNGAGGPRGGVASSTAVDAAADAAPDAGTQDACTNRSAVETGSGAEGGCAVAGGHSITGLASFLLVALVGLIRERRRQPDKHRRRPSAQ